MTSKEKTAKLMRRGVPILIASIGSNLISQLNPARANGTSCNTSAQIANIITDVKKDKVFRSPALDSTNKTSGLVLVRSKDTTLQFAINPLVIECGSKAIKYVALTTDPEHSLGTKYVLDAPTASSTGLYMNSFSPSKVTVDVGISPSNGYEIIVDQTLKEEIVHPFGANIPAFVAQSREYNDQNTFGEMNNGL